MKSPKRKSGNKVRCVVYLPPMFHKMLEGIAEQESITVSQKGAQFIVAMLTGGKPRRTNGHAQETA